MNRKELINLLEEYNTIQPSIFAKRVEIKDKERNIENLKKKKIRTTENKVSINTSIRESNIVSENKITNSVLNDVIKIEGEEQVKYDVIKELEIEIKELERQIEALEDKYTMIDGLLKSIKKKKHREVVRYKYIECMEFEEIETDVYKSKTARRTIEDWAKFGIENILEVINK